MIWRTRRALLAWGGLFLGGASALAAQTKGRDRRADDVNRDRLKLAEDALKLVRRAIGRGQFAPGERDPVYVWSRRRFEARLDLSDTKDDRIAAAQQHLDEMKEVERLVDQMHEVEGVDALARMDAKYRRLEAESWLERERAKG